MLLQNKKLYQKLTSVQQKWQSYFSTIRLSGNVFGTPILIDYS